MKIVRIVSGAGTKLGSASTPSLKSLSSDTGDDAVKTTQAEIVSAPPRRARRRPSGKVRNRSLVAPVQIAQHQRKMSEMEFGERDYSEYAWRFHGKNSDGLSESLNTASSGQGTWVDIGSFGLAQSQWAAQNDPDGRVRLISVDLKAPTDSSVQGHMFIQSDIRSLAEHLPEEIFDGPIVVTDAFGAFSYDNPVEVISEILSLFPEETKIHLAFSDTRVRLASGEIMTIAQWLNQQEGISVTTTTDMFQLRDMKVAFGNADYLASEWNPELSGRQKSMYNNNATFNTIVVTRTGEINLPQLKLVEILQTGTDPEPRLFEIQG